MKEDRPTAMQVLVHWFLVGEVLLLVITGFWLRFPGAAGPFGLSRFLHLVAGYSLFPTIGFRVYWAFFAEPHLTAPFDAVRRLGGALELLRHYWAYALLWLVLGLLTLTGLALRFPAQPAFAWLPAMFGPGLALRLWHYILTWLVVSAVALHSYQTYLWDRQSLIHIFLPPREPEEAGEARNTETA